MLHKYHIELLFFLQYLTEDNTIVCFNSFDCTHWLVLYESNTFKYCFKCAFKKLVSIKHKNIVLKIHVRNLLGISELQFGWNHGTSLFCKNREFAKESSFFEIYLIKLLFRDHSFSKSAKFSEKLFFLNPWYPLVRMRIKGKEMLFFLEILQTF